MWRWYWRISFGVVAVYALVGGLAALVGGEWWEAGLAAEWWVAYMTLAAFVLIVITGARRLIRRH
jgi:hypothetical protein